MTSPPIGRPDATEAEFGPAHASDVLLARRCIAGEAHAVAVFEALFSAEGERVLRRRFSPADRDEILQGLRERLLVGARPLLAGYTGHGSLRSWLRIAIVRTAMNATTRARDDLLTDDVEAFERNDGLDAELSALKRIYRTEFRRAFRVASESLDERARAVLRMSVVDRLGVDRIAAVYGTHRATAARWLGAAKIDLRERIRLELKTALRVDSTELASILQLIRSNVPISASALGERSSP